MTHRFVPAGVCPAFARLSLVLAVALASLLAASAPQFAWAQKAIDQAPSLKLVPEDAAMYGVVLRNKELYDKFIASKAYAKLLEMPNVGPGLMMAKAQYEGLSANPAYKALLNSVLEGLSDEMFIYADKSYSDFLKIYQEASNRSNFANMFSQLQGEGDADSAAQLAAMLDVLNENVDKLKVPDMVIGLRIKDKGAAKLLVASAEEALKAQLEGIPELDGKLTREKIGDSDYLTLKVDGSMIPWDEVPLDELDEPGKYDSLIAKLKTMTVAVSLGLRGDYLIISMADTNEHLATLGTGKTLADRPEMAKLAAQDGKPLRGVIYASEALVAQSTEAQVAPLLAMLGAAEQALPEDADPMLKRHLAEDGKELAADIRKNLPKAGAMLQVSIITPRGFEMWNYDWTQNAALDGSKPLSLLDHVGGDPLAYLVMREKMNPADYDLVVKWLKKMDEYIIPIMEANGEDEDVAKYKKFRADIEPLLARLDKANREQLIPALQDGQSAVVLDAKVTSTQWAATLPESSEPLPMLEIGMVFGVSDAELLKKAASEYFAVVNEMWAKLRETDPEVPEGELPAPKEREFGDAKIWYYLLPKDLGVDKRLAPNAGLTATTGAMTMAPLHTKRLLEKTPLVIDGPIAAYKDKPLAMAVGFNFAGTVDAIMPWVNFGMGIGLPIGGREDVALQEDPDMAAILEEIHTGAEVLKCFKGAVGVTFADGDIMTTHAEWRFEDLK